MPTLSSALVIVLCLATLFAKTANSAVSTSNLNLQSIQSVAEASTQSAPQSGSGVINRTEPVILGGSQSGLSLPLLTVVGTSPKLSFVFPLLGLIAAVAVTQLLRRRRIAQIRASSLAGQ